MSIANSGIVAAPLLTDSFLAAPKLFETAVGIAGADRQMSWMTFAERPMDGLEACRRSATALLLRITMLSALMLPGAACF